MKVNRGRFQTPRERAGRLLLFGVATLSVVALLPTSPASAQLSSRPDRTWMTNGKVFAMARLGNSIYIGGSFTAVMESPTGASIRASNLAAIDATTGAAIGSWMPTTDGVVRALAISEDGTKVYVGGQFLNVNGVSRKRLAALDPVTGALDEAWKPRASYPVFALAVGGGQVYMGGSFNYINGRLRRRLAAVDAAGALTDWAPAADNTVRGLALSTGEDASYVYAGGPFTTINGIARRAAAKLSADTGALVEGWALGMTTDNSQKAFGFATTNTSVYVAMGGYHNYLESASTANGKVQWRDWADGDVQCVLLFGDRLVAGGHFLEFKKEAHVRAVMVRAADGSVDPSWTPTFTGKYYGPWVLLQNGSQIYAGGEFTKVSGTSQQFFARFTDSPPAA